jgi:hypothetical protein
MRYIQFIFLLHFFTNVSFATVSKEHLLENPRNIVSYPVKLTVQKTNDNNNSKKTKSVTFSLPTDSRYEFLELSGERKSLGTVSEAVQYVPTEENVKSVIVTVTLENGPWNGISGESEILLNYVFRFLRYPSEEEQIEEISKDFRLKLEYLNDVESKIGDATQDRFKFILSRYFPEDLNGDFVRVTAYAQYQDYKKCVENAKEELFRSFENSGKFPELNESLSELKDTALSEIGRLDDQRRNFYRSAADTYELNLDYMLDNKLDTQISEPGGSATEFVIACYRSCFRKVPDDLAINHFSMMATRCGRTHVRETMQGADGAFIIRMFEIHQDRIPTDEELEYWCQQITAQNREFVAEQIANF